MQPVELWLCRAYHAFDGLLREAKRDLGEDARGSPLAHFN